MHATNKYGRMMIILFDHFVGNQQLEFGLKSKLTFLLFLFVTVRALTRKYKNA